MKQISVVIPNRVGALADVCETISQHGINIVSLMGDRRDSVGVIRLITEDVNTAVHSLEKKGFDPEVSDILIIRLMDRPGELAKLAKRLKKEGIDVECIYNIGKEGDLGEFALKTADHVKTKKVLGDLVK